MLGWNGLCRLIAFELASVNAYEGMSIHVQIIVQLASWIEELCGEDCSDSCSRAGQ